MGGGLALRCRVPKHVFLASILKQGTLAGWLLGRRRQHRVSLGLPVGALVD